MTVMDKYSFTRCVKWRPPHNINSAALWDLNEALEKYIFKLISVISGWSISLLNYPQMNDTIKITDIFEIHKRAERLSQMNGQETNQWASITHWDRYASLN